MKAVKRMYQDKKEHYELNYQFNVSQKNALIIGGGGKLGCVFGKTLCGAGAHVILVDINLANLKKSAKELKAFGNYVVTTYVCDVTKPQEVKVLFRKIKKKYKQLDILIVNTMAKPKDYYKNFETYSFETWKKVSDTNLAGTFLCCQKAVSIMKSGGSIILTASIYGMVSPVPSVYKNSKKETNIYGKNHSLGVPVVYSVTKAGILQLARHLAVLLAPKNIRVNALSLGGVYDGQEAEFYKRYIERTPLERMASWTDFNGAILFLSSHASSYMTGANLVIDGGWTAW